MKISATLCVYSHRTVDTLSSITNAMVRLWEDIRTVDRADDRHKDMWLADEYALVGTITMAEALDLLTCTDAGKLAFLKAHSSQYFVWVVCQRGDNKVDTRMAMSKKFASFRPKWYFDTDEANIAIGSVGIVVG